LINACISLIFLLFCVSLGILIRGEERLENFCRHIETYQSQIQDSEEREMA